MKLTAEEIKILQHRLEVPDAIIEYFMDAECKIYSEMLLWAAIDILRTEIERGQLPPTLGTLEKEVLADLIEGSTWCGCAVGNVEDAELHRIQKTFRALAKKIERYLGRELERIPCR